MTDESSIRRRRGKSPMTVAELLEAVEGSQSEAFVMVMLTPADVERAVKYAKAGMTVGHAFDVKVSGPMVYLLLREPTEDEVPSSLA